MVLSKTILIGIGAIVILVVIVVGVVLLNPFPTVTVPDDTVPDDTNSLDTNTPVSIDDLCPELVPNFITPELIAVASNKNSSASLVSSGNAASPYFVLFREMKQVGKFENTVNTAAVDANKSVSIAAVVKLLKSKKVDAVVLAKPGKIFATALKNNNIGCYSAKGPILVALGIKESADNNAPVSN